MPNEDLHEEAKRVNEAADAVIKRSGMSVKKRKFALDLLRAKRKLRKMQMVNVKPKKPKPPAKH